MGNQDRTLMSAQSLLLGMFPGGSVGFVVDEDVEDDSDTDGEGGGAGENALSGAAMARARSSMAHRFMSSSLTVCLSVRPHTPLLHGFKNNPVYTAMRAEAMSKGKFIQWAQNPVYVELVEKLWRITGLEKINPIRGGK